MTTQRHLWRILLTYLLLVSKFCQLSAATTETVPSATSAPTTAAPLPVTKSLLQNPTPSRHLGLRPHLDKVLGDRNSSRLILPFENTVIVDGTTAFFGLDPKSKDTIIDKAKLEMLIVINSQHEPRERLRRDVIRRTWGQWAPSLNMKVVFFLGLRTDKFSARIASELIDEINAHHDVIIDNMEEDYYRTSVKTLRMFKWFLGRFPKESKQRPTFLAKADPDCFINLPLVAQRLRNVANPEKFMGGGIYADRRVNRDPKNRHYMPIDYYADKEFPKFLLGCLMIFSSKLIQPLFEASILEKLIPDDDVFISGILRHKLGFNLSSIHRYYTIPRKINVARPPLDGVLYHLPQVEPAVFFKFYKMFNT